MRPKARQKSPLGKDEARKVRALWFKTPPKPLPPQVLKRVGAVPEIHGLQGCWNMAGNRLPAEELKALLDFFASQGEEKGSTASLGGG